MHRSLLAGLALTLLAASPAAADEGESLFALKVRPLLTARCLACHGDDPDEPKGGLDLSTRAGMLAGGDIQGPAIEPGDSGASPLYLAVLRDDSGAGDAAQGGRRADRGRGLADPRLDRRSAPPGPTTTGSPRSSPPRPRA